MKRLISVMVLGLGLAMGNAYAASHAGAAKMDDGKTKQQNKMAECSADFKATGKDGKERQAFMKTCLSDKKKAQQEKMKACAAEGKGKKGDEHKKFMSECLSK